MADMSRGESLTPKIQQEEKRKLEEEQKFAESQQALRQPPGLNSVQPAINPENPSLTYQLAQIIIAEEALEKEKLEEKQYKKVRPGLEAAVAYLARETPELSKKQIEQDLQLKPDKRDVEAIKTEYEDSFGKGKNNAVTVWQAATPPAPAPKNEGERRVMLAQQRNNPAVFNNQTNIQRAIQLPGNTSPNLLLQTRQKDGTQTTHVGDIKSVLKYTGSQIKKELEELEKMKLVTQRKQTSNPEQKPSGERQAAEKNTLNPLRTEPKPSGSGS